MIGRPSDVVAEEIAALEHAEAGLMTLPRGRSR